MRCSSCGKNDCPYTPVRYYPGMMGEDKEEVGCVGPTAIFVEMRRAS